MIDGCCQSNIAPRLGMRHRFLSLSSYRTRVPRFFFFFLVVRRQRDVLALTLRARRQAALGADAAVDDYPEETKAQQVCPLFPPRRGGVGPLAWRVWSETTQDDAVKSTTEVSRCF